VRIAFTITYYRRRGRRRTLPGRQPAGGRGLHRGLARWKCVEGV